MLYIFEKQKKTTKLISEQEHIAYRTRGENVINEEDTGDERSSIGNIVGDNKKCFTKSNTIGRAYIHFVNKNDNGNDVANQTALLR